MDTTTQGFLAEIARHINDDDEPGERATWLIFADYLDESPDTPVQVVLPQTILQMPREHLAHLIRAEVGRPRWRWHLSVYGNGIRPPVAVIFKTDIYYL